jgi:hypothetical protein
MTYACPAWEFAADTHLLKLQRLRNKVIRTIGNFPRHTPVWDLLKAFQYSVHLWLYNKVMQETSKNHTKSWKC